MAHGASTRPLPQSLSSTTSSRIDSHCLGLAVLNLVTVIWGSQHALIKDLVTRLKVPSVLNALRFSIAAACFGLLQIRRCHVHAWPLTMVRAGAELALWQTLGFTLQLFGLNWTTASRSAFLLYLNAPLVPIFAWLMGERLIGLRTYGAASLAVVGTLMLTYDGGPPNMGDMFSVAAAAASAMFIVRLGHFSARINDAAGLNTVALGVTALLSAAFVATSVATSPDRAQAWTALCDDVWSLLPTAPPQSLRPCMELIYLSLVTTALTGWLQAWGQARVKPHEVRLPREPPRCKSEPSRASCCFEPLRAIVAQACNASTLSRALHFPSATAALLGVAPWGGSGG